MALVVKDRIKETSSTTGQNDLTLGGAVDGFRTFADVGDGNTTYYAIVDGNNFEVGLGTYSTSGPTLARTTVLQTSAGNTTKISCTGSQEVFVTQPADKAVFTDASDNLTFTGGIAQSGGQATFNSGTTNTVATFTSTDSVAEIQMTDSTGTAGISAEGDTFQVRPAGGVSVLDINSTSATFTGTVNIGTTGSLSNNSGTFLIDANTNLNFRGGTQTFDNADGSTEYMRLNSTGLGIGGTPDQKMHLYTSSGTTLYKAEVNANSTVGLEIKKTGSTTQTWRIVDGETVNGALQFYDVTDSRVSMQIDGSGNLLVGRSALGISNTGHTLAAAGYVEFTRSGAAALNVGRNSSFGDIADFWKDGANVGSIGSPYGNELYIEAVGSNSSGLLFTSGNSIQPRKNSAADDGNISLGTSGNRFKDLHLQGIANAGGFSGKIHPVNGVTTNYLSLKDSNELNFFNSSDAPQTLHINYDTVNSAGGNLDLSGSAVSVVHSANNSEPTVTVKGRGYGYTHGAIALKSSTGDDPRVRGQGIYLFNEENDTTWYFGTPYANSSVGNRPFDFSFESGTTSLSTITASGDSTASGQSLTRCKVRIHADGVISAPSGIELGDGIDNTADHTLNAYERGTWTPYIGATTSNPSVSHNTQRGEFVRIGNLVHISFYIYVASGAVSGGSGNIKVYNLPFSIQGTYDGSYQFISVGYCHTGGATQAANNNSDLRWQSNSHPTSELILYSTNASSIGTGPWELSGSGTLVLHY